MNRFLSIFLLLFACLHPRGATNVAPASDLLLDQKTVFDLTAELTQYQTVPKLAGKLSSGGSGLVTILIDRWAAEFAALYPDVVLDIQGGGTTANFPAFTEGKFDLMPMSRPLLPEETKQFKTKFGYDPVEVLVAQDGIGIYVNKDNPVTGLTLAQLDGIYSRESRRGGMRAEFWRDLALTGPLQEERIARISLIHAQGTHFYFRDQVMKGEDYRFDVRFEPVSSSLVQAVGADFAGIGFASVMWATQRTRFVPLQAANGQYLLPSYTNVVSGQYPLTRTLRILFHHKPGGTMNPVAREFLRFAVSRRGQRIIGLAHTYPLTAQQQKEALRIIGETFGTKTGP